MTIQRCTVTAIASVTMQHIVTAIVSAQLLVKDTTNQTTATSHNQASTNLYSHFLFLTFSQRLLRPVKSTDTRPVAI